MKTGSLITCLFVSLAAIALARETSVSPKGEGSIPVGRIISLTRTRNLVEFRSGETYLRTATNSAGVFMFDELPEGPAQLTITPEDPQYEIIELNILIGDEQRFIVLANLNPSGTETHNLTIEPITPLSRGQQAPIRIDTDSGTAPTVWVDGGVGSINSSGTFMAKKRGRGRICAQVGHASASVEVTVR